MRSTLVSLLVVMVSACAERSVQPTPPIDTSLSMTVGQTVLVAGTSVAVRFDSVVEDSRCPLNAVCVRAGEAIVQVSVAFASGGERTVRLQSDPPSARSVVLDDGLRLEWERLEPYPVAGQAPGEYRLTVRVRR